MPIPIVTEEEFVAWAKAALPTNWFSQQALLGGGIHVSMSGLGSQDFVVYDKLLELQKSFRFQTAEGSQLDDLVKDYFGDKISRFSEETDNSFRNRALALLFIPLGTEVGIAEGIENTIGTTPILRERMTTLNSCGWAKWSPGEPETAEIHGDFAWNLAGVTYYDMAAYQGLITVYQPEPEVEGFLTFGQIMKLIEALKPEATVMWVRVVGPTSTGGVPIR